MTAFDRKPFDDGDDTDGIAYYEGDVRDAEAVGDVIETEAPDVVVHAAAALPCGTPTPSTT